MTATASDLDRYLQILAGAEPSRTADRDPLRDPRTARCARPSRPPPDPTSPPTTITRLAARTDVYVGVLLRRRRAGGRDACERSHLAFVEIDRPDGAERLARYRCPPTMIIASGGSPGHAHAYWQLHQPVRPRRARAAPTGGSRSASAATSPPSTPPASSGRRPPGIRKRTPPTRVELLELEPSRRYQLAELTAGLTDPPPTRSIRVRQPRVRRSASSTGSCSRSPPRPTCRR